MRWDDHIPRGKTPEYRCYHNAAGRCNNPKNRNYRNYGGRGIEFRFSNFDEFLAHVGLKPSPEYSLDRIDNDGHYEVGNLRWATLEEQLSNRRQISTLGNFSTQELVDELAKRGYRH